MAGMVPHEQPEAEPEQGDHSQLSAMAEHLNIELAGLRYVGSMMLRQFSSLIQDDGTIQMSADRVTEMRAILRMIAMEEV